MKYLKKYNKLNESSEEDIINYLKDIFLELEDIGFNVDIDKSKFFYNYSRLYYVNIYKSEIQLVSSPDESIRFRIKDILEDILTADSYMAKEGYRISHIESQEIVPEKKLTKKNHYRKDRVGRYDKSVLYNNRKEQYNESIGLKLEFSKPKIPSNFEFNL
jgi:hypothetical protein